VLKEPFFSAYEFFGRELNRLKRLEGEVGMQVAGMPAFE